MNKQIKERDQLKRRQSGKRDRYCKISLKTKLIFFRKVIHENANFRETAHNLGLKYSTAKTLMRNYKETPQENNQELMARICQPFDQIKFVKNRCAYKHIDSEQSAPSIQSQVNGMSWQSKYELPSKIQIVCNNIKVQTF